jgi:hypothetical protein
MTSMRIIFSIAAHLELELEKIDIKTAYLHGKIDSEVYVCQPPGFIDPQHPNKVYQLIGNLYGLKQAAKIWNSKFHNSLLQIGLQQVSVDPCIYVRNAKNDTLILGIHVDDCLIAGTASFLRNFKQQLRSHFTITEMGFPQALLGIEVVRNDRAITLHQSSYLKRLVEDTGMEESNHVHTPIIPQQFNTESPQLSTEEQQNYQNILGRVMYSMVATRPDLAFSVGYLGRYTATPTEEHWTMMKRLLRYINGRKNNGITYKKGKERMNLVGYVDADWGGAEDRKSTTGYLFLLNNAPISWTSKKQQTVALSSTEAEYIALAQATKEAIWLRKLLKDLGQEQINPTIIYEDNKSAIALASNSSHHQRTKHIDVQYHFIREKIQSKEIAILHAATGDQLADAMTKGLGRNLFNKFLEQVLTHQPSINQ